MKIKTWLAVPIVALLGWIGLTNLVRVTQAYPVQKQTITKAQTLVSEVANADNTLNIDSLKVNQTKLKEAILLL